MSADAAAIELSLVSHTNVGKTTLARTLLGRDIGEVRDEPHVTEQVEAFALIETPEGDILRLWDTPGFGDSLRLARRLAQTDNPLARLLAGAWDRFRDRPFWSTQQAVRHVRERADVVLYLVNASENPIDACYVQPEMQVLDWTGKPVIVLLNQLGRPRAPAEEAAEVQRWQSHLAGVPPVRAVLPLDAFARCWVQEITLLAAIGPLLPAPKQAAFDRLRAAWLERRRHMFDASMHALAEHLARAAGDREVIIDEGLRGRLRDVGAALGLSRDPAPTAREHAMQRLAQRLDADVRATTERLIALHRLEGRAGREVLARMAEHYAVRERLSEGKSALIGGTITGALTGLKADLASGGLTFGAGLLAGGVLGALGGAGIARGYNLVRGTAQSSVTWSVAILDNLVDSSLLGYLAVAHYGRGRGDWVEAEHPTHWQATVSSVLQSRRTAFAALWSSRDAANAREGLAASLQTLLSEATTEVLLRLYPDARIAFELDLHVRPVPPAAAPPS